jgi:hypothetical protein
MTEAGGCDNPLELNTRSQRRPFTRPDGDVRSAVILPLPALLEKAGLGLESTEKQASEGGAGNANLLVFGACAS